MARKVIAEFDAIDGPFINKLNAIDRSVTRFEVGTLSAFGRVEKGMNGLLASAARLQNVSGIIAGGFGAGMAVQFIDQATRIRRALKEAGDESQEGFNKAFLASQRSLAGFEAFAQSVQRAKKATGGSFDEAIRDMETLNKLLVLGGKTTQERMSTNIQFSQALQAGVLQGEELRSLRENAPIELMRAIAREAGGGIENLKKFGEEGALTTEVMIRALRSLEKEADLRLKSVTLTIGEAATLLGNSGIVAAEGFDKGLGLSRASVAGLTALADLLGSNAEAAEFFGKAVQVSGALFATVFAGRRIESAIAGQAAFSRSLRDTAAAAQAEAVSARASVNTAREAFGIKRSAMAELLRQQDAMVVSARSTATEEAKAAVAARNAAEMRHIAAKKNIAATSAEIAAIEKKIAVEARSRQLGMIGADRRELYGDASFVRKAATMTEDQFQQTIAARANLEQKLRAFDAQRIAAESAVTAAVGREAAARSRLDLAGIQAVVDYDKKTKAQRERLAKQLAVAESRLNSALQMQATTANAASVATARLTLSSRALAAAGNMVRGAFAFLGGWPGLLLTAGTAFLMLSSSAESAADRFARLTSDTGAATGAADALRDVQARLNEAIAAAGVASDDSSKKIIANTREEMAAKRELLKLETQRLVMSQGERTREISGLTSQMDGYTNERQILEAQRQALLDGGDKTGAARLDDDIAFAIIRAKELSDQVTALKANFTLTGEVIASNNALLGETATKLAAGGAAGFEMRAGMQEVARHTGDAISKYEELLAKKQAEIALQQAINQYGEDSAQVAELRAEAERQAYEEMARTSGVTGTLLDNLMAAYDEAVALGKVDVSSGVAAAASEAAILARNLGISFATASALARLGPQGVNNNPDPSGNTYGGRGGDPRTMGGGALDWQVRAADEFLRNWKPPSAGGSGGGGGGNDLDREALQFIESMMTAEEKRAEKLKEIMALRERLVAKYGEEHEMVQRVDEAMQRMNETMEEGNSLQEQFWGTMSDHIAQSIEDWKGWGNFVRGLLASLISQYGEDFFTALFTPGQQSGDGLGTWLGNALTGGGKSATSVVALSRIGTPALDAKAADIAKFGAKLPSVQMGGGSVTNVYHNDFRGVDNVSRDYIEGRLKAMEKAVPNQAIKAVKDAKRKRIF